MTAANVSVILVGLMVGYVLMSWLMSRHKGYGQAGTGSSPQEGAHAPPAKPVDARASWHDVLQVPATASLDEVKLAYRRRIAEYHPDKTGGLGEELKALAEEKSKLINAAYEQALRALGK